MLIFSKTGRDFQAPAPVLFEIFLGMAWGNAKSEDERGEGEKLLGKTCFSGFFSSNSHYSGIPEGGEVRGEAGALQIGRASCRERV